MKEKTISLLQKCQIKNGWNTDYKLAKGLEIPNQRIYDYKLGKRTPDTYALVRIAECLGIDPLALIAEYGVATAKHDQEREFWRGFLGRAGKLLAGYMLALVCTLSLGIGQGDVTKPLGGFRRRFRYA